jgi:hypothetical protein
LEKRGRHGRLCKLPHDVAIFQKEALMEKVYRIYTQDVHRNRVIKVVTSKFESFTLQSTRGYFKGRSEKSIVIEIVEAKHREIDQVARAIREVNGQKSVLVMSLTGKAYKIR